MASAPSFLRTLAISLERSPPSLVTHRRAAVAIILRVVGEPASHYPREATLSSFLASPAASAPTSRVELLFIRRAIRDSDKWSGHVAFPGGMREASDADDVAAAARECVEEVGVDPSLLLYVGRLGDRRATARGRTLDIAYAACVFVAPTAAPLPLTLQPSEVAAARWAPVSALAPSRQAFNIVRDPLRAWLGERVSAAIPRWVGLGEARLASIDLPVTSGACDDGAAFRLWGMTLLACSDLCVAGGGAGSGAAHRLAWPPARLTGGWDWVLRGVCAAVDAGHACGRAAATLCGGRSTRA